MLDAKNRNIDYLSQQNWCANNLSTCTYQWGLGPAATYKVRNKMNMFEFGKKIQKSDCRTMHWSSGTWAVCLKPSLLPMRWKHAAWLAKSAVVGLKCRPLEIGVKSCESWWIDRKLGEPMLTTRLIFCLRAIVWLHVHAPTFDDCTNSNGTALRNPDIRFVSFATCQQFTNLIRANCDIFWPSQTWMRHRRLFVLSEVPCDGCGFTKICEPSVSKKNVVTISKLQRRLKQIQHPKQHCANGKEHKRNCYHHHKDLFCALEIVNWSLEFWIDFVCWPQFDLFRVGFQPQNQLVFHSISCLGIVGNTSREQKICMANRCWFAFCC